MTVSASTRSFTYPCNGSTVSFGFPAGYYVPTDIYVALVDVATGSESPLVYSTDYDVVGVPDGTGGTGFLSATITLHTAPTAAKTLVMRGATPITQTLDLSNTGFWNTAAIEDALDRLTEIAQESRRDVDAAASATSSYSATLASHTSTLASHTTTLATHTQNIGDLAAALAVGGISNLPAMMATQAEAEAGTSNAKVMNALRTKQAFNAFFNANTYGAAIANGPYLTSQIATATIPGTVTVFRTYGYAAPDPFGGVWWKAIATPGAIKAWHRQSADGRWWQMSGRDAYPQAFGAAGDSTAVGLGTDDTAAIENWRDFVLQFGARGRLAGMYRYRPTAAWNMAGFTNGWLFQGDMRNGDGFNLDAGFTLEINFGNGFYGDFDRVHISGNVNGPTLRIGKADFSDAVNGSYFDLVVNNAALNAAARAIEMNYVLFCRGVIVANCGGTGRPGQPTTPGFGAAIETRQCAFNNFQLAGGQANVGLLMSTGFNYANSLTFDLEEVAVAARNTSANTTRNDFRAGQILGTTTLDFTAGAFNVFQTACNLVNYPGGALGTNLVGIEIKRDAPQAHLTEIGAVTPGAYWTNTTPYKLKVKVFGSGLTVTWLKAADGGVKNWSNTASGEEVLVPPGWAVRWDATSISDTRILPV